MPGAQGARLGAEEKALRAAEQDREGVAAARAAWRKELAGIDPRRLVFLHLDGSEVHLPGHGTPVRLAADGQEGRQLGFVTTSARHHELGPIALALVKRNVAVDAELIAGDTAAAQETVVEP